MLEHRFPRTVGPRLAVLRSLFCDDDDTLDERLGVPVLAGADGA
jgi:hypothetical protein